MKRAIEAGGILLLRKEKGETSFEALSRVKKALSTGRVGHTGTLDKFARGLLIVLAGRATKLVPYFVGSDKVYEGTILFGSETDTLDPEGRVIAEAPPPSRAALEAHLESFRGTILQTPPLYSAIHIEGRRAHEIARSGQEAHMAPRPVVIHSFDLLSYDGLRAEIRVHCSKGTYIRSLARDLARAAQSRAHLSDLNRLRVGGYSVESATKMDGDILKALRPVSPEDFFGLGISCYQVDSATEKGLIHGKPIREDQFVPLSIPTAAIADRVAVFSQFRTLIAVLERREGTLRYGYVYGSR